MNYWRPWMEPHEADLDFIGTLTALADLLGSRVAVQTSDREGVPVVVARFEGVLRFAQEVSVLKRADAEAQFFNVTDSPDDERVIGFMVHAGAFGGGQAQDGQRVRFLQGGVLVDVSLADD